MSPSAAPRGLWVWGKERGNIALHYEDEDDDDQVIDTLPLREGGNMHRGGSTDAKCVTCVSGGGALSI